MGNGIYSKPRMTNFYGQTRLTTPSDESWFSRGKGGRRPPSFAYYTQVEIPEQVSFGMAVSCLDILTEYTGAHYMWVRQKEDAFDQGRKILEIWAHPDCIQYATDTCKKYIQDCVSMTPIFY